MPCLHDSHVSFFLDDALGLDRHDGTSTPGLGDPGTLQRRDQGEDRSAVTNIQRAEAFQKVLLVIVAGKMPHHDGIASVMGIAGALSPASGGQPLEGALECRGQPFEVGRAGSATIRSLPLGNGASTDTKPGRELGLAQSLLAA
jgi:hypothetical protein